MNLQIKYVHTNIVADDWRMLARFYEEALECTPIPPERDYHGSWVADVTGLENVSLAGIHLRLPGYGDQEGPTLEIFTYRPNGKRTPATANRPGFAHIAFHVNNVEQGRQRVLAAGGKNLGKIHTMHVSEAGTITLLYMTDPEGNMIELQKWSA